MEGGVWDILLCKNHAQGCEPVEQEEHFSVKVISKTWMRAVGRTL